MSAGLLPGLLGGLPGGNAMRRVLPNVVVAVNCVDAAAIAPVPETGSSVSALETASAVPAPGTASSIGEAAMALGLGAGAAAWGWSAELCVWVCACVWDIPGVTLHGCCPTALCLSTAPVLLCAAACVSDCFFGSGAVFPAVATASSSPLVPRTCKLSAFNDIVHRHVRVELLAASAAQPAREQPHQL